MARPGTDIPNTTSRYYRYVRECWLTVGQRLTRCSSVVPPKNASPISLFIVIPATHDRGIFVLPINYFQSTKSKHRAYKVRHSDDLRKRISHTRCNRYSYSYSYSVAIGQKNEYLISKTISAIAFRVAPGCWSTLIDSNARRR